MNTACYCLLTFFTLLLFPGKPATSTQLFTANQLCVGMGPNSQLEVFCTASDNRIYHSWQQGQNGAWNSLRLLSPGDKAKTLAVGRNYNSTLELFYAGENDKLYHNIQKDINQTWAGEAWLGNNDYAKQICTGNLSIATQQIFYIGTNNQIYYNYQQKENGSWAGEHKLNGSAKQLSLARNYDKRLELCYIGTDNRLYHNWQDKAGDNNTWVGETRFNGLAKQMVTVNKNDGAIHMFYIGTDNRLYHQWQIQFNGTSGWAPEASFGVFASSVAAGINAQQHLVVFFTALADSRIFIITQNDEGIWGAPVALNGAATKMVTANNYDGRLELFYTGTNDALYHNWERPGDFTWVGEQAFQ